MKEQKRDDFQNQVLKQFAPVDVLNSLAALVQQHQQKQQLQVPQQQLTSSASTPNPLQHSTTPPQNVSHSSQSAQQLQQQQSSMPVEAPAAPRTSPDLASAAHPVAAAAAEQHLPPVAKGVEKKQ
ncbi:unnamed protein product [Gongylonema pulchrum]|uniref:Histone-fold n=1 Tax=Gongylonema pulchrum TaxID=637853 RepID=A0A183ELC6_9BILA|nr:unnamed protein product [Gongylonema pulchrum]